jgi:hypothetical protein
VQAVHYRDIVTVEAYPVNWKAKATLEAQDREPSEENNISLRKKNSHKF